MTSVIAGYVVIGFTLGVLMDFAAWLYRQAAWVVSSINW